MNQFLETLVATSCLQIKCLKIIVKTARYTVSTEKMKKKNTRRCNSPPHCPLHSLRLPQWSRTPISVDVRVGPIHQRPMGNGINRWQWSSALQTMAHKHPLTSGQMREKARWGLGEGLRECMQACVCLCVCVCVYVCASTCVSQSDREGRL